MPRVSFIIPAFNAEEHLEEALRSVQSQTCGDWEIVVCDDCSTDATAERVLSFIASPTAGHFELCRSCCSSSPSALTDGDRCHGSSLAAGTRSRHFAAESVLLRELSLSGVLTNKEKPQVHPVPEHDVSVSGTGRRARAPTKLGVGGWSARPSRRPSVEMREWDRLVPWS